VEGVEGDPAAGAGQGGLPLCPGGAGLGGCLQPFGQVTAQGQALLGLPVFEGRTVFEVEAFQEIGGIGGEGGQRFDSGTGSGEGILEGIHIQPEGGRLAQGDRLTPGQQQAAGWSGVQGGQHPAQVGLGVGGVIFGPQQGFEGGAGAGFAGEAQVDEQGESLARFQLDGRAGQLEAGSAQAVELPNGHLTGK